MSEQAWKLRLRMHVLNVERERTLVAMEKLSSRARRAPRVATPTAGSVSGELSDADMQAVKDLYAKQSADARRRGVLIRPATGRVLGTR